MEFREANRFRVHQLRQVLRWLRSSIQLSVPCGLKQHAFGCEAGTKSMAHPRRQQYRAATSLLKTNMTVADDMLPNRRNTSREWRSVSSERPTLFCTASRIVRPPGWMAQCAISSGLCPPRIRPRKEGALGKLSTAPAPQAPYRNRVRQYAR